MANRNAGRWWGAGTFLAAGASRVASKLGR